MTLREAAAFWESSCGRGPDLQAEAPRGEGSRMELSRTQAGWGVEPWQEGGGVLVEGLGEDEASWLL